MESTTAETMPSLSVTGHARRAFELGLDYLKLQATAQKSLARKQGARFGTVMLMGAFAVLWAELAVFLALSLVAPGWLAALLLLLLNSAILGLAMVFKPSDTHHEIAFSDQLERKKDDAATQLRFARAELRESVVAPIGRIALPAAMGVCFIGALLLAKRLFPAPVEGPLLTEGDVRNLI
jgi:hypothetical protein